MKSYYQTILNIPQTDWDYYFEIDRTDLMNFPFGEISSYDRFIYSFFERGGKVKIFEECDIDHNNLYRPNHICSVFFLGILLYNNTSLHQKYHRRENAPGYQNFPFIWFLIALFHDNACQKEKAKELMHIHTVAELNKHFNIEHDLLKFEFLACTHLAQSRVNYFRYIRQERGRIEHGIAAAVLLYDRLVKIRRKKQNDEPQDERLFWDESLEEDYQLAAQAISLHNIWLPKPKDEVLYKKYNLDKLIGCPKVKFADFPLFYILAIADTIEPIKEFKDQHSDIYILKNIQVDFMRDSISVENALESKLDFSNYINKVKSLEDWLDIHMTSKENGFNLRFN